MWSSNPQRLDLWPINHICSIQPHMQTHYVATCKKMLHTKDHICISALLDLRDSSSNGNRKGKTGLKKAVKGYARIWSNTFTLNQTLFIECQCGCMSIRAHWIKGGKTCENGNSDWQVWYLKTTLSQGCLCFWPHIVVPVWPQLPLAGQCSCDHLGRLYEKDHTSLNVTD